MEPKSGKLHKLGSGFFGPKWSEKWVHLDGTLLKCFPMAVGQQVFSLGSSRQSSSLKLLDYKFVQADEKKVNRKFAFQLESIEKSSKTVTFVCSSEKELAEWRYALSSRLCLSADDQLSPVIAEKIRRAAEAFKHIDTRHSGKIGVGKLYGLLQTIEWEGKDSEVALMQQQLDLTRQGVISRTRLLTWLQNYYCSQEVMTRMKAECTNNQVTAETCKIPNMEKSASRKSSERVSASKRLLSQGKTDWNRQYYALETSEPSADVFGIGSQVSSFLAEFRLAAEILVSEIISEMVLDDADKTIHPQSLESDEFFATDDIQQYSGLLSVLQKYQRDGLLVYLCGYDVSSGSAHQKQQHAASVAIFHKMVSHQVRAAKALHEAIQEVDGETQQKIDLQVPLQCTVDHLGFRAFVIASSESMVKSTRKSLTSQIKRDLVTNLHEQLKVDFNTLGLLTDSLQDPESDHQHTATHANQSVPAFYPHSAGFYVEAQEEGAIVRLQNLSDLIPADVSSDEPDAVADEFLLFKMRPEFIRRHGNNLPLHSNTHTVINQDQSDGNSSSSQSQLEAQLLQQSASSARECLHTIVIPEFVSDLENATIQVIGSRALTRALHEEGINVRYLASCYELASLKHIRRVLLVEMVARACKVELRASLRAFLPHATAAMVGQITATRDTDSYESNGDTDRVDAATARALAKMAVHEEATSLIVEFFNLVLGVSSPDSKVFWKERILAQLHAKFGLSCEALNLDTIISEDLLHLPQLFHAMQFHTGFSFADHMNYNFKVVKPLSLEDLQNASPSTVLTFRTSADCENVLERSDAFLAAEELISALSSIMFHISILETAPNDERNLSLCHLLTCAANISFEMNLLGQANRLALLAIEDSPKNHADLTRTYTVLMKLKHRSGDLAGTKELFTKALEIIQWHLGPVHPLLCDTYMTMTEILGDLGEAEQAAEILQSCVAIVRDCFGKTSLLYADIRRQQGLLMYAAESKNSEAISGVLEDAFSVYEKHFADPVEEVLVYKEFAAECCYLLADLRTRMSESQAAEAAYGIALTALRLRKEILPPNHEDMMKSYLQLGRLSRDLVEHYRAIDYYKPALLILKTFPDDEHIDQIRSVTQTMLQLHLQTLSSEKQNIVEKTASRYSQQWPRFALLTKVLTEKSEISSPDDDVSEELALLTFAMKKLFQLEPVEYIDVLIDKTDLELQDYRKQYNLNFAGTFRRSNADAPSPQYASLRSSSGRFASFSSAGTFSPPGSPRSPMSRMHHPTLFPASPRSNSRTSFNQLDCNFLKSSTGDFTFGAQLAALLFLIDHPGASISTDTDV